MSIIPVAPQLGLFPDAEEAVRLLLADLVAVGSTGTETPSNMPDAILPFIRVSRFGGQADQWTDSPRIDVDVFVARGSRTDGVTLAATCLARLLSFPHVIPTVGVIDRVDVDVSPNEVPWINTDLRLITSSFKVTVRR